MDFSRREKLSEAEDALNKARNELSQARNELGQARDKAERTQSALEVLRANLDELYASRSWRLTKPLRLLSRLSGRVRAVLSKRWDFIHQNFRQQRRTLQENFHVFLYRFNHETSEQRRRSEIVKREPDRFVLYRIIGNDLLPRHTKSQSRENVNFIIENEEPLEHCEKAWIVNRIFDPDEERAIIAQLEASGHRYIRVPFQLEAYAKCDWDLESFRDREFLISKASELPSEKREMLEAATRRLKNNYVMNNNGARNIALRDGRGRAKWILPWDGNCFMHPSAWREIVDAVSKRPDLKYFAVPMLRLSDNKQLLKNEISSQADGEPQIIFRRDAVEEFNENFPYGRRPKVELLWRLGISGPWDRWCDEPWDLPRPKKSADYGRFRNTGWVARLASGREDLEVSGHAATRGRGMARNTAIIRTLDSLDEKTFLGRFDRSTLMVYSEAKIESLKSTANRGESLEALAEGLVQAADGALERGPYSVIDKSTIAPSGDRHDYWHPAPYWWPNPSKPDGLPYVRRDGKRVPGTELNEPLSDQFDRTRLQRLLEDTTILALAWRVTNRRQYAEHGANLVRRWFLTPESRMNPSLRYAQVRMGHNGNEGAHTGIIEMKDLYFFLDAVRLLERANALEEGERADLRDWLRQYLDWLLTSNNGVEECQSLNNHGTCFDLQVAAIAAYLEDVRLLILTFRRARARILQQFEIDGRQPHELKRSVSEHYCAFNLQSWTNLAKIAESCGDDVWTYRGSDGRSIKGALEWLLPFYLTEWPYRQDSSFDRDRFLPLYFSYRDRYGDIPRLEHVGERFAVKPMFFAHDGISPYWMLT